MEASEENAIRQITVVRPGALGDTLLTLPALALLRRCAPGASLTLIARADTLPLALANGLADRAWAWELPDWGALFGAHPADLTERAQIALAGADIVVVWAPDPAGDIARQLRAFGVKRPIVAPAQPPLAGTAEGAEQAHAAFWLAETLRPLDLSSVSRTELARLTPPLRAPGGSEAEAEALWRRLRLPERVVALHPGSGSQAKRWPARHFAAVARLTRAADYAPLLLAGEADDLALAQTQAELSRLGVEAQVARGLDVATLAALLARCAGYVGCDSGVSHLAGLVGAPTVAVFGPTDPAVWAPLGQRVRALRSPDGRLDHVSPDAVWAALLALISSGAATTPS